jgi:hypothetical protein
MMLCDQLSSYRYTCASQPWLQTNTDYVPTLRILNSKNKTMRIWREGIPDGVIVNPGATEELQTGDKVDIVSGLPLTSVSTIHHSRHIIILIVFSAEYNGRDYAALRRLEKSETQSPLTVVLPSVRLPKVASFCDIFHKFNFPLFSFRCSCRTDAPS